MSERHDDTPAQATNRELAAEIKSLSDQLGVETPTQGKAKAELLETLERLRSQLAEREAGAQDAGSNGAGAGADVGALAHSAAAGFGGGAAGEGGDGQPDRLSDHGEHDPEVARSLATLDERSRGMLEELLARGEELFDNGDPLLGPVAREAGVVFMRGAAKLLAEEHPALARALLARFASSGDDAEPSGYKVARGHSLTTRRGIIAAGEPVGVDDVVGGLERLEHLRRRGRLVRS